MRVAPDCVRLRGICHNSMRVVAPSIHRATPWLVSAVFQTKFPLISGGRSTMSPQAHILQ